MVRRVLRERRMPARESQGGRASTLPLIHTRRKIVACEQQRNSAPGQWLTRPNRSRVPHDFLARFHTPDPARGSGFPPSAVRPAKRPIRGAHVFPGGRLPHPRIDLREARTGRGSGCAGMALRNADVAPLLSPSSAPRREETPCLSARRFLRAGFISVGTRPIAAQGLAPMNGSCVAPRRGAASRVSMKAMPT